MNQPLQLWIERCGSVSPVRRYVLTTTSIKILHKCDETSLAAIGIAVSLMLSEKWPLPPVDPNVFHVQFILHFHVKEI